VARVLILLACLFAAGRADYWAATATPAGRARLGDAAAGADAGSVFTRSTCGVATDGWADFQLVDILAPDCLDQHHCANYNGARPKGIVESEVTLA
jgi:hypothetical protein